MFQVELTSVTQHRRSNIQDNRSTAVGPQCKRDRCSLDVGWYHIGRNKANNWIFECKHKISPRHSTFLFWMPHFWTYFVFIIWEISNCLPYFFIDYLIFVKQAPIISTEKEEDQGMPRECDQSQTGVESPYLWLEGHQGPGRARRGDLL